MRFWMEYSAESFSPWTSIRMKSVPKSGIRKSGAEATGTLPRWLARYASACLFTAAFVRRPPKIEHTSGFAVLMAAWYWSMGAVMRLVIAESEGAVVPVVSAHSAAVLVQSVLEVADGSVARANGQTCRFTSHF